MLECIDCDFTHHIPRELINNTVKYSVDVDDVRLICVYGPSGHPRQFTGTLEVKDFFRITPVPEAGRVLRASIVDNIKPLHSHMLSHCDPLFLIIQQSSNRTAHQYKNRPDGNTYVTLSGISVCQKLRFQECRAEAAWNQSHYCSPKGNSALKQEP